MTCETCNYHGPASADHRCPNCMTIAPGSWQAEESEQESLPELADGDDLEAADAGARAILKAAGDDPDLPEMAETSRLAVRAQLSLSFGNDADPAELFPARETDPGTQTTERATLSASVNVRSACRRCMMPVFGEVKVRCVPGSKRLDGGHLTRAATVLAARYTSETELAEQVAAAIVDLGGAASASARVSWRRPCDECGGGRAMTTARARRASRAESDSPRMEGG